MVDFGGPFWNSPGGGNGEKTVTVPAGPPGVQGWASASKDLNDYINRPADPRLNTILSKMHSPLRLGIIQQTDDYAAANGQWTPYACRFMFNPPTINVGYRVATDVLPPGQQTVDQLAASAAYPGSTSISFQLMFDRTYEVHYGSRFGGDLRRVGVYHDIHALEQVIGVTASVAYGNETTDDQGATTTTKTDALQGNMLMVPVYVLFGGGSGAAIGAANTGLAYVGYFESVDVTYTLFSANMIPTRALVTLQMTQIVGRKASDYSSTLIDRAHNKERGVTTAALPGRSVENSQ